jgi:hypothetical protein
LFEINHFADVKKMVGGIFFPPPAAGEENTLLNNGVLRDCFLGSKLWIL